MRELVDHKVGGVNDGLDIRVVDEPGAGGACHEYEQSYRNQRGGLAVQMVSFQNGPIQEAGINGVTQESLLAIVIDRLRGFQSGLFGCRENAIALTNLEEALMWLQKRTRSRLARGVEGTNKQ